jgi:ABC-type nitrate/sulfonate/bicarbonate transport system substrate-binding protein
MTQLKIGGVPEHFNLPWHLCIEAGDFEKHNIQVSWKDFHGGTGEMSEALKAGEIDIAVMLTEGCIKEICDGSPFKIIQTFVKSPLMWGIHVSSNSNFYHIRDLKDQTAAISRYGSGSHLMTYVHADNQDWNTNELSFKPTQSLSGAKESLLNGTSDYFLWEHFTTKPLVDEGIFRRLGDEPTPWPCFVIVATEAFLNSHANIITGLLNPLNEKSKHLKTIEHIEDLIAERYSLKAEDVSRWLKVTEWSQQQLLEKEVNLTQKKLLDLQLIQQEKNYAEFIFNN